MFDWWMEMSRAGKITMSLVLVLLSVVLSLSTTYIFVGLGVVGVVLLLASFGDSGGDGYNF